MPELYTLYNGDKPVAYAYGEPWVAQALMMNDWQYPTPEEAVAAWERYLNRADSKSKELSPCPFCKSKKLHLRIEKSASYYAVECIECEAVGPTGLTLEEAEKLWNRRCASG